MSVLHGKGFLRVLALLAMLLFVGDLMADSVAELCEKRCAAESSQTAPSHEKAPCHCTCAVHVGAVIATDFAMQLGGDLQPANYLPGTDEATPPRLATSIDHPPQLA